MQALRTTLAVALLAALGSSFSLGAQAQEAGKTRAQVVQETIAAVKDGDILAPGESGLTLRQIDPGMYPATPVVAGRSRGQIVAETREAIKDGDIIAAGELEEPMNQLEPSRYPAKPVVAGLSRGEVVAQTKEAIRTGDIIGNDQSGLTLREENPSHYAKVIAQDAAQQYTASAAVTTVQR